MAAGLKKKKKYLLHDKDLKIRKARVGIQNERLPGAGDSQSPTKSREIETEGGRMRDTKISGCPTTVFLMPLFRYDIGECCTPRGRHQSKNSHLS